MKKLTIILSFFIFLSCKQECKKDIILKEKNDSISLTEFKEYLNKEEEKSISDLDTSYSYCQRGEAYRVIDTAFFNTLYEQHSPISSTEIVSFNDNEIIKIEHVGCEHYGMHYTIIFNKESGTSHFENIKYALKLLEKIEPYNNSIFKLSEKIKIIKSWIKTPDFDFNNIERNSYYLSDEESESGFGGNIFIYDFTEKDNYVSITFGFVAYL